ncbi:toll/interleukin-1 receptor domain-containing protein [Streptomyces sp. HPF1205]|uniref:toll/interleukin-1 receptor domain-containing protein n=1 Tax=Streptomyces sp. HPF1205 TaxID=2873262 RepID=UPI001CECEEFA|nr:toll/interleukin-1 receptor domain-containing protein [Streptomyces sp. HPF1205]
MDSSPLVPPPVPVPASPASARPGPRVFINYRTSDEPFGAALIDTALCERFGCDTVFFAPRSLAPGTCFSAGILDAVAGASVVLVVIGPRWLQAVGRSGRPRLEDPGDWVRREIVEAFRHDVCVVPVLLNCELPAEYQLPVPLARLSTLQYLRLHHRNTGADLERLVRELGWIASPSPDHPLFKSEIS